MLNSGQFECLATTTGVLVAVGPISISHGHFLFTLASVLNAEHASAENHTNHQLSIQIIKRQFSCGISFYKM